VSWGIVFRVRQRLKASLVVIPLLGALLGPVAGQLTLWLDRVVQVPEAWRYSASTASGVLSVLVGAMVGLLGFVVTVSVLVVQMATSTLSPRFMRLWYRDHLQKLVLAMFAGTLTFSFSLLRRVESASVPNIGVTAAGFLVAASLLLLLLYLDRFTHLLRPVAVAALVAGAGRRVLGALPVPPTMGVGVADHAMSRTRSTRPSTVVRAARPGAIQAIDGRGLIGVARRHGCFLVLLHSVGDFVPAGAPLLEVFGAAPPAAERRLRRMFVLGRERTIEQDPAFALRILVDIAIRALSPAVNDPTTAVQVLDYIEDLLLVIGRRGLHGRGELRDGQGRPCVVVPVRRWEQYLQLGVTEIRQYGATSVQVTRRLRAALEELRAAVASSHRAAVEAELCKLDATVAESVADAADRSLAAASDRQGIGGPPGQRLPASSHDAVRMPGL
jgi:uncharacterized membrane protein